MQPQWSNVKGLCRVTQLAMSPIKFLPYISSDEFSWKHSVLSLTKYGNPSSVAASTFNLCLQEARNESKAKIIFRKSLYQADLSMKLPCKQDFVNISHRLLQAVIFSKIPLLYWSRYIFLRPEGEFFALLTLVCTSSLVGKGNIRPNWTQQLRTITQFHNPGVIFLYKVLYIWRWGARCWWRSWLIHYATSRKFAGSIPDTVVGLFYWHNPSDHTMALGSNQPLTEMSTRNISWGVKAAGA
jgi:hypothetical protein